VPKAEPIGPPKDGKKMPEGAAFGAPPVLDTGATAPKVVPPNTVGSEVPF